MSAHGPPRHGKHASVSIHQDSRQDESVNCSISKQLSAGSRNFNGIYASAEGGSSLKPAHNEYKSQPNNIDVNSTEIDPKNKCYGNITKQ